LESGQFTYCRKILAHEVATFHPTPTSWINLPGGLLIALLQRTPAVQVAATAEDFALASPISAILKASVAGLASLGGLHSLAGATNLATNGNDSPLNVTVGTAIPPCFSA